MTHWLLRVADGVHFILSSPYNTWGVLSTNNDPKYFLANATPGDILWFVKGASRGLIIAVATYTGNRVREIGPLLAITTSNEELGWTHSKGEWDTEIHYTHLYNLTSCGLFSEIKSPRVIRTYNEKCKVNLPLEYSNIVRYSKITRTMS